MIYIIIWILTKLYFLIFKPGIVNVIIHILLFRYKCYLMNSVSICPEDMNRNNIYSVAINR